MALDIPTESEKFYFNKVDAEFVQMKHKMSGTPKKAHARNKNGQIVSRQSSPVTELEDFKNVTNSLVQDALTVWADLWAELESRVEPDGIGHRTNNGFEPSCGWNEYLEKMWVLKHYLDFVKRLSQQ